MNKLPTIVLAIILALAANGCFSTHYSPVKPYPPAIQLPTPAPELSFQLYRHVRAPLTVDFDDTPTGTKHGKSSGSVYLDLILLDSSGHQTVVGGDCNIENAAKNGEISEVFYAEYEYFNLLGLFARYSVHVYGE
ncbi:TRL domain-containing protein [Candidatus Hydrogenedentota bacterium]